MEKEGFNKKGIVTFSSVSNRVKLEPGTVLGLNFVLGLNQDDVYRGWKCDKRKKENNEILNSL